MIRAKTLLVACAALLAVGGCNDTVLAQTAQDAAGEWTGTLETPRGNLTLVIYLTLDEQGALSGELESVDQAPGQRTPLDEVSVADGEMTWKVPAINASYAGGWAAEERQWQGTFTQGIDLPLTFSRGLPEAKPVIEGMDGRWEGIAEMNGAKLRQVLRIETGERGTSIVYDSPDQMANGLPVSDFTVDGRTVTFSLLNGISRFAGTLNEERTELSGTFTATVNDNVATVSFTRGEIGGREPPKRPQMPQEPFPYAVEEVSFGNPQWPGVRLAGTLTLPEGEGPFPAAVMITGSGGQDRDETLLGHKPFWVIADHLTRNGIAVLRFDDRGVGQSESDTPYEAATSADLATDANAAFAYLRTRPEIDPLAIGFIGHSEGGMIAPIAMAANPYAAYAVLLAGPGTNLDRLMLSQRRLLLTTMGASQEDIDRQEPLMAAMFRAVAEADSPEAGKQAAKALLTPEAMASLGVPADTNKDLIVGQFSGSWFRYFLKYDPVPNLARIRVPLLALGGSLDLQVPADDNLAAIRDATKDNPDVTIVKLDGLNHLFQHAATGGVGEYATIEETFAPEALELIAEWINRRFGAD